jgi:hypothetical protein
MKTKISLRTKITLTMLGLFATAGIFYAATPNSFAPVHGGGPVGVAAAPGLLVVTEYCSQNVDTIDCGGNVTTLATIPGPAGPCVEKYITIAPSQSGLPNNTFTPGDIFVTKGAEIYKISGGVISHFATIPDAPSDHTGITFDHVGTFGWNMIVTTSDDVNTTNGGKIYKVDGSGQPTLIANTGFQTIKGPAVVPAMFGTYSGQLLVADDLNDAVHAIDSTGQVTPNVFTWAGAGAVVIVPSATCTLCSNNPNHGVYYQAIENLNAIYQYQSTDFTVSGGGILVASTTGAGSNLITLDGANYTQNFFDKIAGTYEGSAWTDCDVPPPTPTPSPSVPPPPPPAPTNLTVTAATGTYGGTASFNATLRSASDNSPIANATITFKLNGNAIGSATTNTSGVAKSISVSLVGSSYNAGTYGPAVGTGAEANFAGDSSYGASYGNNALTINKAPLTVSADNKSRLFGAPNPPLTAVYTGFVNHEGDTHGPFAGSGVAGMPTITTSATQNSPVGTYPITIAAGTLMGGNNYLITLVPGTLTVTLCGGEIIGLSSITIGASSALVDSYNSSIGYATHDDSATLLSNGPITLQGAKVHGDIIAAGSGKAVLQANSLVTGEVDYGTTISLAGSAVVGSSMQQANPPFDAPIPAACGSYTQAGTWITGAYTYDSVKGNLTVSGGGMATMGPGTYCFNNVTVSGGSTLAFSGAVIMNVTGKFTDSGGSLQNPSLVPANLQVFCSYTGSNGVTVSGTSATYMAIYAPGTGVTVSGTGAYFGSLVGKTLVVSGNSQVHQDLDLPCWQ